jgi:hypothetical protein
VSLGHGLPQSRDGDALVFDLDETAVTADTTRYLAQRETVAKNRAVFATVSHIEDTYRRIRNILDVCPQAAGAGSSPRLFARLFRDGGPIVLRHYLSDVAAGPGVVAVIATTAGPAPAAAAQDRGGALELHVLDGPVMVIVIPFRSITSSNHHSSP